jgi:hypothetical protein
MGQGGRTSLSRRRQARACRRRRGEVPTGRVQTPRCLPVRTAGFAKVRVADADTGTLTTTDKQEKREIFTAVQRRDDGCMAGTHARGSTSPYDRRQSREGHTGDALASSAEEGRGTLRKARASRVQTQTARDVRMGKPGAVQAASRREAREPGELKHLSSPRKRKDSASSGERKWKSLNRTLRRSGL